MNKTFFIEINAITINTQYATNITIINICLNIVKPIKFSSKAN